MDGTLSRESVKPFSDPRKWLGALDADRAAMVIAAAADLAVVVDQAGVVCDVANSNELRQLGTTDRWIGLPLSACVTGDSVSKIESLLQEGRTRGVSGWRQVNHPLPGSDDVPILYSCASLGSDDRMLFLGRDLRPMAMLQQRLLHAQQAMEREYARLRQAETRYRLLFQLCGEGVVICEAASQRIVEVNPAAAEMIGPGQKKLVGRTFPEGFDAAVTLAQGGLQVTVHASLFRQDHNAHLLIRITQAAVPSSPQESPAGHALALLEHLPDGFVVTNSQGRIRSANLAFLDLAEVASEEQVRGEELGRWLGRPGVDFPVLMNNMREHGTVRLFASLVRGEYGSSTEVEVSGASTPGGNDQWIGFSIRPVLARPRARSNRSPELPRSLEQLNELIGRVPLKDLVRETTDVIERMCIESALMLTGDNRASAAEMLGLSRQSLYVKLHRYGLGDLSGPESEEGNSSD